MGDTPALNPFTRTSSAKRSAFSRLANTPSCTAQPDSEFGVAAPALAGFAGADATRVAAWCEEPCCELPDGDADACDAPDRELRDCGVAS
jgi:hypothetical protein